MYVCSLFIIQLLQKRYIEYKIISVLHGSLHQLRNHLVNNTTYILVLENVSLRHQSLYAKLAQKLWKEVYAMHSQCFEIKHFSHEPYTQYIHVDILVWGFNPLYFIILLGIRPWIFVGSRNLWNLLLRSHIRQFTTSNTIVPVLQVNMYIIYILTCRHLLYILNKSKKFWCYSSAIPAYCLCPK